MFHLGHHNPRRQLPFCLWGDGSDSTLSRKGGPGSLVNTALLGAGIFWNFRGSMSWVKVRDTGEGKRWGGRERVYMQGLRSLGRVVEWAHSGMSVHPGTSGWIWPGEARLQSGKRVGQGGPTDKGKEMWGRWSKDGGRGDAHCWTWEVLSVRGDGGGSGSGATTKLSVPDTRHEGGLPPRMHLCSGLGIWRLVVGGGFLFGEGHATRHVGSSPAKDWAYAPCTGNAV